MENIRHHFKNWIGKTSSRKLITFCVDDWGGIRTRNREAVDYLRRKGANMDRSRFSKYDSLASENDLMALFDVLSSVKDSKGNGACFTVAANPCNPNIEAIKANGYSSFVSEPFTETLQKYGSGHENAFEYWKEGLVQHLFYPIFHGTEHVSRKLLMNALSQKHQPTLWGFECDSVGIPHVKGYSMVKDILCPYAIETPEENETLKENIQWGLNQFEKLFGFRSRQFKAGGDVISPDLYPTLANAGIAYLDEPLFAKRHLGNGKYKVAFNYFGKKLSTGQRVMVRNATFEPTYRPILDSVGNCLRSIEIAFSYHKPVLISSHRVNYVGSLDERNRREGLGKLSTLLHNIVKLWPDVEFVNADQVGDILCRR